MQNTSHAVMAQRTEPKDSADDFPSPPWATRGLIEHILENKNSLVNMSCLEPACDVGHMAKVLKEYFGQVHSGDAYLYGYGHQRDFLKLCDLHETCEMRVLPELASPASQRSLSCGPS